MLNKKMAFLLGGMFFALSANASVTDFSSGVEVLVNPAGYNVGNDNYGGDENNNIVVFEEQYSFQLGDNLLTNTGTIGAGTYIGSYLVNYNPITGGNSGLQEISFSDQILGIIWSTNKLDATDSLLGRNDVTYQTKLEGNLWRGLEELGTQDLSSYLNDTAALRLKVSTTGNGLAIDQMRVITAAPVPLPAAVWMFGAGLIGLVGFARRSANKTATAAA